MKIGIFDSGIGGLSVLDAFIHYPIAASYHYIADSGHLPYGTKHRDEINERVFILSDYLINVVKVDLIVIACNTATAISIDNLRKQYENFPILGIEPAIKPAVLQSKTDEIAIAATSSTLNSERLASLVNRFAENTIVNKIYADDWVIAVEENHTKEQKIAMLEQSLAKINHTNYDHLILGCTHFPFLIPEIKTIIKSEINLINPAQAVAKYAKEKLVHIKERQAPSFHYYTTGELSKFNEQINRLMKNHQGVTQILNI